MLQIGEYEDRVKFLGKVDESILINYLSYASALVIPSFYEGFGLPALEAMTLGTPVLAANTSSLPEVCGPSAVYFNPSSLDEIAKALTVASNWTNGELDSIRIDCINRSKLFTWEKTVDLTADAFEFFK